MSCYFRVVMFFEELIEFDFFIGDSECLRL